jgi:hypothetical protein
VPKNARTCLQLVLGAEISAIRQLAKEELKIIRVEGDM